MHLNLIKSRCGIAPLGLITIYIYIYIVATFLVDNKGNKGNTIYNISPRSDSSIVNVGAPTFGVGYNI